MEPEGSLSCIQESAISMVCVTFRNKLFFYGAELFSPSPNPQPGRPLLSAWKKKAPFVDGQYAQ
jgi:hypothetical protein